MKKELIEKEILRRRLRRSINENSANIKKYLVEMPFGIVSLTENEIRETLDEAVRKTVKNN